MAGQARVDSTVGDTVIGVVGRDRLGSVLAAVHGGGFGPLARVFDPARGTLAGQLARAGLPLPPEADEADPATVLLAVTAPGRAARVADAMSRGGARRVYATARGVDADIAPVSPPPPRLPVGDAAAG
jgi:hypothetical protein